MINIKYILASKSPRRQELLKKILPSFDIITSEVDENIPPCEPQDYVMQLAQKKAACVAEKHPQDIIIGADTTVFLDGKFFGKPENFSDAKNILRELSGKTHEVYSGVCIICGKKIVTGFEKSRVTFANLSEEFIEKYIAIGVPMDKAGAYGIQEKISPVANFEGEFENIMGLPLKLTKELLSKFCV